MWPIKHQEKYSGAHSTNKLTQNRCLISSRDDRWRVNKSQEQTNPRIHRFPFRTRGSSECVCTHITHIYIRTHTDIITRAKHRVGTRVLSAGAPAGNPVKHALRPDGMNYGQSSTPDTPFTDHSGEPLATGPLHLSSFLPFHRVSIVSW